MLLLVVRSLALLAPDVQARHFAPVVEMRLKSWERSGDARPNRRCQRATRVGRATFAALAALGDELDPLAEAALAKLREHISPLGMARIVVRFAPSQRDQFERLLVYEDVLEAQSARKIFKAMKALDEVLGTERLEATLWALDGAVYAGSSVIGVGSVALGALGELGSGVCKAVSQVSVESLDILNVAAAGAIAARASICNDLLPSIDWTMPIRSLSDVDVATEVNSIPVAGESVVRAAVPESSSDFL